MKIKYKGLATVRTIMQYRWDKANGYVCDVPVDLAANLLTYPRPDFELVEDVAAERIAVAKILETPASGEPPMKPRRRLLRSARNDETMED